MNTTLLFAELIIIGLQASLWLLLLITVNFGAISVSAVARLGFADWQTMFVISILSIIYIIGIILDRFADLLFSSWDKYIRNQIFPNPPISINVMKAQLSKDSEYVNRQFEYTRSRIRISRASAINFSIMIILALQLLNQQTTLSPADKTKYMCFGAINGFLLVIGTLFTWERLTRLYYVILKSNWDFLSMTSKSLRKQMAQLMHSK